MVQKRGIIQVVWYTSGSQCEYGTTLSGQGAGQYCESTIGTSGDFVPMGCSLSFLDIWRDNA